MLYLVDEAGLADVGEACDEECARVGVDGREAGEVLPDLLQVCQALVLPLHDGAHSATQPDAWKSQLELNHLLVLRRIKAPATNYTFARSIRMRQAQSCCFGEGSRNKV